MTVKVAAEATRMGMATYNINGLVLRLANLAWLEEARPTWSACR